MMRILSSRRSWCLLAITLIGLIANAQKTPAQINEVKQRVLTDPRVRSVEVSTQRGTPSFIVLNDRGTTFSPAQSPAALSAYLGLRSGIDNLVLNRTMALRDQVEVQEFFQYYKGIKVEHSRYASFVRNGNVKFFNGAFYEVPQSLSTQARITEAQALGYAKASVGATVYAWEALQDAVNKATNAAQKAALQEELNEYLPKGELVIVRDFRNENVAEMRLAYKFNIYSFEPISRQWIYVDAQSGEILLVDKIIKHVNDEKYSGPLPPSVATTVQTRYAGVKTIYTKQVSGTDPNNGLTLVASNPTELGYVPGAPTYVLIDDTKGGGIETYDLNGVGGLPLSLAAAYSQAKSFTDMDNNWTLAEHARGSTVTTTARVESENDDIAWDAHWGASVVYDYWKLKHNRLSFDGKNAKIKSYIHSGIGYDNAFWNGRVMTYGDGSYPARANGFRPLTSLDVCGHEIGHGICTFTSDLVYAKESGAMNEGFSDIWAACVEYFAMKADATLSYKPWYIGEQIAANPARPLRRMDSPQAEGDPDTYGGNRWINPNCTPTLANDYCGVHTNSGVLNKWFYLLTVGSGAGSGPDSIYAGVDDGINDKLEAYSVTGLGFDMSEKIAYITETLLTSTATFAEARAVSIQVATDLSGSGCSDLVKQVTSAWYAVNVGDAFAEPCKITYGFITQPGSSVSEGQAGSGCNAEYEVKIPVLLPPNSTATVAVSGSAANNIDYRLGATSLSNTGTTAKAVNLSVFVVNDGVVESDEAVNLSITVTNVGTNTLNNTYRLNIVEDDVTPVIGTASKSLLNATFDGDPDGFSSPSGWTELPLKEGTGPTGENYNQWGVWKGKLMITGKLDAGGPVLPEGTYNDVSPTSTIIKSPQIDGRGLSNLLVKFNFRVQGEIDPNGADIEAWGKYDYMEIVYSFDGVTFYPLTVDQGFGQFASAEPTEGVFEAVLPSFLNNKMFYLGFKWFNDTNAGGPESVQVDNVSVTGSPRQIENDLGHSGSEKLLASQNVYFYSTQDGQILGSINNTSAKSFGCTSLSISKAGNGTYVLDLGTAGKPVVSEKAVKVTTEVANKATTTVTLYFTEAQLLALEAAAKTTRNNFAVYQVNAAELTGASGTNTSKLTATYTSISGVGGYYTVSVGNKLGGSHYLLGYAAGGGKGGRETLLVAGEAPTQQMDEFRISPVYPNPVSGNAFVNINSPENMKVRIEYVNVAGQLVQVQQQQVSAGMNKVQLNLQQISAGAFMLRFIDEKGNKLDTKQFVKQ